MEGRKCEQSGHLETTANEPKESARISVGLMAWDSAHVVWAKEKDRFVRAERGRISGWWRVQGDAFPGNDPFTGDEIGVDSAYTFDDVTLLR